MNEHDEDLRRTRLYLQMDDRELANARAEYEKNERRKAAMQRGDLGSPIAPPLHGAECGPLSFAPLECSSCRVKLTSQNHATERLCQPCHDESQSLMRYEIARQGYLASKRPGPWGRLVAWVRGLLQ